MSLAKYKKVKYLGKGSYGAALLVCLKSNSEKKFVIKEIVVGHLKQSERDAAEGEAKVLSQMTHSNITMYVESFIEGSKLYIVMEHADGGDLTAAVKRRAGSGIRWPENEVMRIFVQICLALKHVHDHNILHRDLKSQNIFLTQKGIVKLGDFGIAKVLDATEGQAQTQIGTPYYLSPEICESKPYGRKSDVWSLGIVLFELLALELPFQAQSLPALVIRICSADPDFGKIEKDYSSHMLQWVKALLHKSPDKRPEVVEMLNSTYFKKHISRLLSHTIRVGSGGAESAIGTDEPAGTEMDGDIDTDEVDRNIERERCRQREQQEERERNSKEVVDRAERDARRKEEIDKLKKIKADMARRKDEMSEDVVYVPASQPVVRPPPAVNPHISPRDADSNNRERQYRKYEEEKRAGRNEAGFHDENRGERQRQESVPSVGQLSEEEEALYRRYVVREQAERERQERYLHHQAEQQRQQQYRGQQSDPSDEEELYRRAINRGMEGYGHRENIRSSSKDYRGVDAVPRERSLADIRDDRMRQRLENERNYVANEVVGHNKDDRDGGGFVSHEEQLRRHKDEIRRQYQENQSRANEYRRKAAGAGPIFGTPTEDRVLTKQPSQEEKFESAARKEFFANRAAAQQIKARVEAYERGGSSAVPGMPSAAPFSYQAPNIVDRSNPKPDTQGSDRVAMIKAQKQFDREQEVREHERRMQAAAQEQMEERRRYEERMKQQGVVRRPSDASEQSREDRQVERHVESSDYDVEEQRRRREKEKAFQRDQEEQERIQELERARLQLKEQRRQLRDNAGTPSTAVAFDVNFVDVNKKNKPISPALAALKAGKKSPAAAAPRQRRGWGAPAVPPVLSGEMKSGQSGRSDSPTEIVSDEEKTYREVEESKTGARSLHKQLSAEEIPEDTLLVNGAPQLTREAAARGNSYDLSSLAYDIREIDEDERAVMRVIEARKDREQHARDQAREVFRKLREQRRKEAEIRAVPSTISRDPKGMGRKSTKKDASVKDRSPAKRPVQSPVKSTPKKIEAEAMSVAMMKTADGLYELSSTSSSEVADEIEDDLEGTLDRYLNKMRGDISRPTKTEEIEHINYSDIIEEDKSLTNGVAFDDDGAMADLQCMLANALMESGQFRSLASEEGKNEDYYYYDGQQNK